MSDAEKRLLLHVWLMKYHPDILKLLKPELFPEEFGYVDDEGKECAE